MITVVSGLPRSGTSLMMQMLAAGGLPLLTDGVRRADEDNPRGYFEFEPVKATQRDASWVALAEGKAVKLVYPLLRDLPGTHEYRVIMMIRDPGETLDSQQIMLTRSGRQGAKIGPEQLRRLFAEELADIMFWLRGQPHFRVLEVQHSVCMKDAAMVARSVNLFLAGKLNEAAMAAAVDPALYRRRG